MSHLPTRARMASDQHAHTRADECERLAAYHEYLATLVDGPLAPHLITMHLGEAATLRARAASYRARTTRPTVASVRRTYQGRP